jgi:chemotaxis protein methyltransferase CheR
VHARDFAMLSRLVRRESGVVLDASDEYAIDARISQLVRAEGYRSVAGLIAATQGAGPAMRLRRKICEAITVNETRFFRDERTFDALVARVVPELLERRRELAVWCAAVASGQEALSVLVLLREAFPGVRVRLVASDLSTAMIERARRGVYSEFEVSRGLSTARRDRYFVKIAEGWCVKDELRSAIELVPLNLAEPWPSWPPFDLVLMRNVLVYLDSGVREDILVRTRSVLSPGGVLLLGAAEAGLPGDSGFTRFTADDAVFYRLNPRTEPA